MWGRAYRFFVDFERDRSDLIDRTNESTELINNLTLDANRLREELRASRAANTQLSLEVAALRARLSELEKD